MLFDAETSAEIDGLRRALGEPDLGRIPPHLTLVPPVNVREVDDAGAVVRAAAHAVKPFELELGPGATFLPDNPVSYLSIGGDLAALGRLRDGVFQPPLERELTWPFVPHVTIADGVDPDVIAASPHVLHAYNREVTVHAVHLLEEQGRRWIPIGVYPLGPPRVIGRGGAPIELDVVDIDGNVTITAYADGVRVGRAAGWRHETVAYLRDLEVTDAYRDEVDHHLAAAFRSWAADNDAIVTADSVGGR